MNYFLFSEKVGTIKIFRLCLLLFWVFLWPDGLSFSQHYGKPSRELPGDLMIQNYLAVESKKLHKSFHAEVRNFKDWDQLRPEYGQQYLYMLGLDPLPKKTPLKVRVTGIIKGDGFVVEKLHYQSRPGLYVTANLYRPADPTLKGRMPAVLYLCGHTGNGRNGNKTSYQSHGIWFARHGYICLIVDSLQLGEITGIHHGTYSKQQWWWHSRGYTPAGVETWNAIRGIDYLFSRSDVDSSRLAVTGISGGGAVTFWVAAADERVRVAVPVSAMADLPSYVSDFFINGHCDCMFFYNTFLWPWTRIGGLIAPRALLFINSDADPIFPMNANERVINRLERHYSLFGLGDEVQNVVSIGRHRYRKDIRQAVFRFINTHLQGNPARVVDSEKDLVIQKGLQQKFPIEPQSLRVFPKDSDIPTNQINTSIDHLFVPMAKLSGSIHGSFTDWRTKLLTSIKDFSFPHFPVRVPPATFIQKKIPNQIWLKTESEIKVPLWTKRFSVKSDKLTRLLLWVNTNGQEKFPTKITFQDFDQIYVMQPRGAGLTRWSVTNPPNFVKRAHALLGRTSDSGKIWDIIAVARYLNKQYDNKVAIFLGGESSAAVLVAYAALLENEIEGTFHYRPFLTHMDSKAPQLLNILRTCDIPEIIGLLAPRPVAIMGISGHKLKRVKRLFHLAGAIDNLVIREDNK